MNIGIVKERKDGERRVACTPTGVKQLVANQHAVYIEAGAGEGSGYADSDYQKVGGKIVLTGEDVFENAQFIYKVKELTEAEYGYLTDKHTILSFLHTNSQPAETEAILTSGCTAIALEDITNEEGEFPLLKPMSELAGKVGFIESLTILKSTQGGYGLLLNNIQGLKQPHVVIFGAGNAARGAAELAAGFGNKVTLLGRGAKNIKLARQLLPKSVQCSVGNREAILNACRSADVIINCVLWPKNRKGHLLSIEDLAITPAHCVIVDVACDEKGAIESCRPTSISAPTYVYAGRTHFCVDNMPAYYAKTATDALCQASLPYVSELANKGVVAALLANPYLRSGLTAFKGQLTIEETAIKQGRSYVEPTKALLLQ